jgi:hypothetical protein
MICETHISKITREKWAGRIECLLHKCEALSSKPPHQKKKKKKTPPIATVYVKK